MALKLMPGETRNYTFKLPDRISDIDTIKICFFQDGGKKTEYNQTDTDNVYGVSGEEYLLVCSLPREETLKFENRIRAVCQIEWSIGSYHKVAKDQRITVGTYYNKEFLSTENTEESGGVIT